MEGFYSSYAFRRKGPYQKDGCLFCDNHAPFEIAIGSAQIRTCGDPSCTRRAMRYISAMSEASSSRTRHKLHDRVDFESLLKLSNVALMHDLHLIPWCDPRDAANAWSWGHAAPLFLFPRIWWKKIPLGFPVVDIYGDDYPFSELMSPMNHFGWLSFGVLAAYTS